MKRDFTAENYQRFFEMIEEIECEDWCGATDWFGDMYLIFKHWLGDLGIYDKTSDMDEYHKELLDRKNTSRNEIREIFETISEIDIGYASDRALSFGETCALLKAYQTYLRQLTEIAVSGCTCVSEGGKLGDYFNTARINAILRPARFKLNAVLLPITFNADNFYGIPEQYKKEYVKAYEQSHPDQARQLDRVLSDPDLTENEKTDICFLIYTSPEPYRTVYLQHIDKYKVVVYDVGDPDGDGKQGSLYSSKTGKVYLKDSDDTLTNNPRGPYNTFFHECGHALDDYENTLGYMTSENYSYQGKDLVDWIRQDTTDYVSGIIDDKYPNLSEKQKQELMKSLNLTDDASYNYQGSDKGLSAALKGYRAEIVEYMKDDLYGEVNEAASDVYGGVTNNAILGSYGHRKDSGTSGKDYTYWYSNGKATGSQASELWAEFFAAQMTQDEASLASIKEHFPNAYKAMEEMARKMAAK